MSERVIAKLGVGVAIPTLLLVVWLSPPGATTHQLLPSDRAAGQHFGWSVCIAGDHAIVGAYRDGSRGKDSGAAYVFLRQSAGWSQQAKLTADDGDEGDWFGWSVSISGDYAAVGASRDDDRGEGSGSVYVFQRKGATWAQQAKLIDRKGGFNDRFGSALCMYDDRIVVGAEADDDNGISSGSAYVFRRQGDAWYEEAKLVADDGTRGDLFGSSLDMCDDHIIVGAAFDDEKGRASGSAYIFEYDGADWIQQVKLTARDAATEDRFGCSVGTSGDCAIVGAYADGVYRGAVYIFVRANTTWVEQQKLTASDGGAYKKLGESLSLSGARLVVGASGDQCMGTNSGSVYRYEQSEGTWTEIGKTAPPGGAAGDFVGRSVSIDGDLTITGAPNDNGDYSGAAYVQEWGNPIVELGSFSAGAGEWRVGLAWTTLSERDNVGFHVYRSFRTANEGYGRITEEVIPGARTSNDLRRYAFVDERTVGGTTFHYKLAAFDSHGRMEWHGSVTVTTDRTEEWP